MKHYINYWISLSSIFRLPAIINLFFCIFQMLPSYVSMTCIIRIEFFSLRRKKFFFLCKDCPLIQRLAEKPWMALRERHVPAFSRPLQHMFHCHSWLESRLYIWGDFMLVCTKAQLLISLEENYHINNILDKRKRTTNTQTL